MRTSILAAVGLAPFLAAAIWTAPVTSNAQARPGAATAAPAGAALFRQRCGACHSVTPGQRHGIGPNIAGVVGRKPASAAGYNYSTGMRSVTAPWTARSLDAFLAAPARTAPGTRMTVGVASPADRAAIIAYLQTAR